MKVHLLTTLLLFALFKSSAQPGKDFSFDTWLWEAVDRSEKAVYNADVEGAYSILNSDYFKSFNEFEARHEVLLLIKKLRVSSFDRRLAQQSSLSQQSLKELLKWLQKVNDFNDNKIKAQYYSAVSGFYSGSNLDSCIYYEDLALRLFEELEDFKALAEARATRISRMHLRYLTKEKKKEALDLIPEFEKEIAYSSKYSKYALAYNTRHLANIYRVHEVDMNKALALYQQSLKLREELGFKPFIPASHYSIGITHRAMGNMEAAIEAFSQSLQSADEVDFVRYKVMPHLQLGDLYQSEGDNEKAKEHYTLALKAAAKDGFQAGIDQAIKKLNDE